MSIKLAVISPEKKVFEEECISVTLPTVDGQITVLPGHAPIFSLLKPGEMLIKTGEKEISLTIGGGFVNVSREKVTVLPEFGVRSEELDEEKIKEAKARAEELLKLQEDDKGSAMAQASLARSLLELKIIHKRRTKV